MTTEAAGGALSGGGGRGGDRQPHFQSWFRFRSGADRALRVVPAGRVSKGTASVCTWLSAASMSSNNQRQQHVGASCPGPPGGSRARAAPHVCPSLGSACSGGGSVHGPHKRGTR